jgi:hypothetical protein
MRNQGESKTGGSENIIDTEPLTDWGESHNWQSESITRWHSSYVFTVNTDAFQHDCDIMDIEQSIS